MFLEGGWADPQHFKHPRRFPSGPPHGWVYQRRPQAGSFQCEQWLGDATGRQEEGPAGPGAGGGAEEGWLPKPDSPQPRGGLESRSRKRFLSNVPFGYPSLTPLYTCGGLELSSELFCGCCLICSQGHSLDPTVELWQMKLCEVQDMLVLSI